MVGNGSIGPHEGRELQLMLVGSKPLSVFVIESPDLDWYEFPEEQFDEQVALGNFRKAQRIKRIVSPQGKHIELRIVYYSRAEEEWRISAFMFIEALYEELGPGYRPDLERVVGKLLGYQSADIDAFINEIKTKGLMSP